MCGNYSNNCSTNALFMETSYCLECDDVFQSRGNQSHKQQRKWQPGSIHPLRMGTLPLNRIWTLLTRKKSCNGRWMANEWCLPSLLCCFVLSTDYLALFFPNSPYWDYSKWKVPISVVLLLYCVSHIVMTKHLNLSYVKPMNSRKNKSISENI